MRKNERRGRERSAGHGHVVSGEHPRRGMRSELAQRVARAAALLGDGGLVAYPTETFYGLGALYSRTDALARLASAKLRPGDKPLPLIAADWEQVERVAWLDPRVRRVAERFWPGALTLVLPAQGDLDSLLTANTGTVAIRIPGSPIARALAQQAGGPLVSTSANLSGDPPVTAASDISPTLLSRIDGILDGGPTPGGLPSTIVSLEQGGLRLIRAGSVLFAEVEAVACAG